MDFVEGAAAYGLLTERRTIVFVGSLPAHVFPLDVRVRVVMLPTTPRIGARINRTVTRLSDASSPR